MGINGMTREEIEKLMLPYYSKNNSNSRAKEYAFNAWMGMTKTHIKRHKHIKSIGRAPMKYFITDKGYKYYQESNLINEYKDNNLMQLLDDKSNINTGYPLNTISSIPYHINSRKRSNPYDNDDESNIEDTFQIKKRKLTSNVKYMDATMKDNIDKFDKWVNKNNVQRKKHKTYQNIYSEAKYTFN